MRIGIGLPGFFLAAGAISLFASPAIADVKAGVDAWSRGDFALAVSEWREPAEKGDPDAQFNLGQAYSMGRGVEVDLARAETLFAAAAASGHVRAADNFGLLLFQRGERERAMPYVIAAAGRGDPRAQYYLGTAHFNGDLAAKDWPRAYALALLASEAGLKQADPTLATMRTYLSPDQIQRAQALALELKAAYRPVPGVSVAAPSPPPAPPPSPPPSPPDAKRGVWKLQLGTFSNPANADRLWHQLEKRQELSGRTFRKGNSGRFTVLYAGGFESEAEAQSACRSLKRTGQDCIVSRN